MADRDARQTAATGTQFSLFGRDQAPEVPGGGAGASTPAERAAELNRILSHAAYAYYALDDPEMTDAQFDRYLVELQQI